MKKVYFACSIRGGRGDAAIYAKMGSFIKPKAKLLTERFTRPSLTPRGGDGAVEAIRQRNLDWMREADGFIAEVTNPSLGVGYQIAEAERLGIPILALYRPQKGRRLSAMIAGSSHVQLVVYDDVSEVEQTIHEFIELLPQSYSK